MNGKKLLLMSLIMSFIISTLSTNMVGVTVAQAEHDIAILSVTPSPTLVEKGNLINITVVVKNQGDFNETFTLNCTYDENLIEPVHVWGENVTPYDIDLGSIPPRNLTLYNVTLASGVSQNVTFNWNTTGFWDHTSPQKIAATASIVSGETDTEDNSLVSSNRVRVFVSPYVGVVPHTTVNSNLTIGTNYTVSIYTDYNGSDITGYQFTLSYNPNILNGVEATNGDLITNATNSSLGPYYFQSGTFDNTAGKLSLTGGFFFLAGDVVPGPGILANVTFTVVGEGDSAITLGIETQLKGWDSTEEKTYDIVSNYIPNLFHHLLHGFFQNAVVTHDVAVVSVTPYPTIVIEGENVTITVVIENQGTVAEDVTVKVYYDYNPAVSLPIETKVVSNLAIGTSRSINFTWNTANQRIKNYTITGLADELLGETDTDDNMLRSDISVKVKELIEAPIPLELIIGIVVVLVVAIAAVLIVFRRKKRV